MTLRGSLLVCGRRIIVRSTGGTRMFFVKTALYFSIIVESQ
jgi:hypothetical protein